jgi:methylenetetrahydrofolate dehydrogenase (NADP+)/methenyltetrahydrofolate cyclohydrolase
MFLERKNQPGDLRVQLDVILVGDDPASEIYVAQKQRACFRNGIHSRLWRLPEEFTTENLCVFIENLNDSPDVTGILLQLPLPPHIDAKEALFSIDPHKDVDGIHPENLGQLSQGIGKLWPCTPKGCLYLLDSIGYELRGKHAVVVGSSFLVGKPLATMLTLRDATVTLCHKYTKDLESHVRNADVLAVAVGHPHLIPGDWVKEGAVVIDIGINRMPDGSIIGDVEFEKAKEKAFAITPVPGGVGPMTVAVLMENAIRAAFPLTIKPKVSGGKQEEDAKDQTHLLPQDKIKL